MRVLFTVALLALLTVAGCSKDKDVEPPAKLVDIPTKLPVKKLWSDGVGGGKKQIKLRLGLGPALDDGVVYAASRKGEVIAANLETGKRLWVVKIKKMLLSAGPAAGFGMVVVGSSKGDLIALEAATGHELWRSRVNSELLSAPAIGAEFVIVRSVDGRLHALNAHSGKEQWQVEQQMPHLTLRGTATPIIAKDFAVSGFDDGKVMAVSLASGDTVWDTTLSSPHGKTELDRLNDIDSAVRVVGDNIFVTGYQGRTAMLALDSGQIWWSHDMSSYRGLAVDEENLYVTQDDGVVVAMRQRDGSELWRNDKIRRRALTAPIVTTSAIAVADFQGYIHWLDRTTGELVARTRAGKRRISSAPAGVDDTIVVLTDDGNLTAFRATPKAAAAPAAAAPPG